MGRGFRRGRGGNHGGKSNASSNNKNDSKSNAEMKFIPHYSGKQLTHTYDTLKDHIVLKNFRNGQDMTTSIRDMKYEEHPGRSKPWRKWLR